MAGTLFTCLAGTCGERMQTGIIAGRFVDNGDGTVTDRERCRVFLSEFSATYGDQVVLA